MTSNQYVRFCKQKDGIEDQTLKKANENIQYAEDLEGDLQVYTETVHPLYEEQRDQAKDLLNTIESKQSVFTRENAVRILKLAANEKYKQGTVAQKSFNKSAIKKEQFLQEFIDSRKEFYRLQAYTEIIQQAA